MAETRTAITHIRILEPNDPRIALYRDVRERDLVGRQDRFIAEGKVVLERLLSTSRFPVESVLVLENKLEGTASVLRAAPPNVPIYVASGDVMNAIAGFPMHRGVLAIGRRTVEEHVDDLLAREDAMVAVCVGISNHDNVGSIFRNAAAFGADAVLLDRTCCDPLYRKAIRVSVGASLTVPFAILADADEAIGRLSRLGYRQIALTPAGDVDLRSIVPEGRTAIYLGAEGPGLSQEVIARLMPARIGIAPGVDSLNVAAASAIALHHLSPKIARAEPVSVRRG